ncbi:hypothetical protein NHP200010_09830 [Helicobacter bizzozeronii]|uniref:hypothetical protein n=1 Tax=Helicobacter bizzozeronii TaxID=56877 RepID=UPI00244D7EAA|nr:hypothetical protein [Helicobacter bizzozeronii]GMB93269.1 hypothetical protein NHP200010_09830 [Helicobacter bizzozeronii]
MSLLPNHYPLYLRCMDEALGGFINKHTSPPFNAFYTPTQNPHLIALARCFDVDLDTKMPLYQQHAQLDQPLLKKIYLGTQLGIQEACHKVFGPVQVISYANQEQHPKAPKPPLKPFEYQVHLEPNVKSVVDVKRAISAIKQIQPIRDRFKRLVIDFPQVDMSLRYVSGASLRAGFDNRFKFSRTIKPPLSVVIGHRFALKIQTRSQV